MSIGFIFLFLLIFVLLEIPVGFSLIGASLLFLLFDGTFSPGVVASRMPPGLESFPFLALPLFVFVGAVLSSGGIARRIFDFANCMVGHTRGGLGHVNVLASIFSDKPCPDKFVGFETFIVRRTFRALGLT